MWLWPRSGDYRSTATSRGHPQSTRARSYRLPTSRWVSSFRMFPNSPRLSTVAFRGASGRLSISGATTPSATRCRQTTICSRASSPNTLCRISRLRGVLHPAGPTLWRSSPLTISSTRSTSRCSHDLCRASTFSSNYLLLPSGRELPLSTLATLHPCAR